MAYKQATFQPTIRPSWAGTLSYIPEKERSDILIALTNYPKETDVQSRFWEETIKPDLDLQYERFISTCQARSQVARTYWDKQLNSNRITNDKQLLSNCITNENKTKDKDKDKDKDKNKDNIVSIDVLKESAIKKTSAYQALQMWKGVGSGLKDTITIDADFNIFELDHPQTKQMIENYGDGLAYEIQNWLRKKYRGKSVEKRFIIEQFYNFYQRRKNNE